MPLQPELWDAPPLGKPEEKPAEKNPAMYLIALRAHLNRGKTAVGDLVESAGTALPKPPEFSPEAGEEQSCNRP